MEAQGVEEKKVRKMLVLIESLRSKLSAKRQHQQQ